MLLSKLIERREGAAEKGGKSSHSLSEQGGFAALGSRVN
jgi:hypothetical protein